MDDRDDPKDDIVEYLLRWAVDKGCLPKRILMSLGISVAIVIGGLLILCVAIVLFPFVVILETFEVLKTKCQRE